MIGIFEDLEGSDGQAGGITPPEEAEHFGEWTEEDVVSLHWMLLRKLQDLGDPACPIADKLELLQWVFTEPELENKPFSFANCVKVVGLSPLSPTAFFGVVDLDQLRTMIAKAAKEWLNQSLDRYPPWVRDSVLSNLDATAECLAKNPQRINQLIKQNEYQGALFA